jgi:hypothetical protein
VLEKGSYLRWGCPLNAPSTAFRGVQKNRITEKTEKTDGKLTEKTEPR